MAKKTRTAHRDAGDGQFVTKKYADAHPKTTVKEHNPVGKRKPKK
ncbi:MAG: multidrug transporter [Candidatus Aenigmarchaeota archaeon]|nr:multidrug transporter [Candidatus Aenigmarchaeota archaeon]